MSFRETERKNVWKSKVVAGKNHENIGGTTHIIERKSKIANSQA